MASVLLSGMVIKSDSEMEKARAILSELKSVLRSDFQPRSQLVWAKPTGVGLGEGIGTVGVGTGVSVVVGVGDGTGTVGVAVAVCLALAVGAALGVGLGISPLASGCGYVNS